MPVCSTCGEEHEFFDPTFRRPEAYVRLHRAVRAEHVQADDDLCRIALPGAAPRYFVRGVVPVQVAGRASGLRWGVWAEVSEDAFRRIFDLWTDANQESEPPFSGELANVIPSYDDTLGLPLRVHLTGPQTRPRFSFDAGVRHRFIEECVSGVDAHRASEWNTLIDKAA